MNIDDIQAFLAVVSNQSLTKAAEILHLSQSSVSHRLKNLEQELDLILIERGKGLKPSLLLLRVKILFQLPKSGFNCY
jgi:DNA-binding transcriptional LysR family regulator